MEEGETTRQKWRLAFYKYLQLLGGKALSAKHAKQHVRQILNMLNAIDPDADDIVCLTDDQGLSVAVGYALTRKSQEETRNYYFIFNIFGKVFLN